MKDRDSEGSVLIGQEIGKTEVAGSSPRTMKKLRDGVG